MPEYLSPMFSAILALSAMVVVTLLKKRFLKYIVKKHKSSAALVFGVYFVYGALLFILAIPILAEFGVPTASLITILGTSSLAIGLALKGFLSNIAAGVMLVVQKPFDIGDSVEVAGVTGTIEKIELFSVKLRTLTNEIAYVPNGKIMSDKIVNKNIKESRRQEVRLSISYGSNTQAAKELIKECVESISAIEKEPKPVIIVDSLSDSSIDILVRYWVKAKDILDVKQAIYEQSLIMFEKNNINVPFPQLDVRMYNQA